MIVVVDWVYLSYTAMNKRLKRGRLKGFRFIIQD